MDFESSPDLGQPDVQSQQGDQGGMEGQGQGQQQQQGQGDQQAIDYEKAYKNLEKDYTRKSQKLAQLEAWEKFQEQTGITAEQALQQLEQYQQQQQAPVANSFPPQQVQTGGYAPYPDPYQQQFYEDPRLSQLEQQLQEMRQSQQIENLRKKFPQFDEMYSDVMNLAQSQGLDIETAFGRLMVERWDDVKANTEKQVIERIRAKGLKSIESSADPHGNDDETANLTEEELTAARLMGISPEEYAKAKNVKYSID